MMKSLSVLSVCLSVCVCRWYFALISVSGIFAVTFSVIFAYVADITEEHERSTAYGLVTMLLIHKQKEENPASTEPHKLNQRFNLLFEDLTVCDLMLHRIANHVLTVKAYCV